MGTCYGNMLFPYGKRNDTTAKIATVKGRSHHLGKMTNLSDGNNVNTSEFTDAYALSYCILKCDMPGP